MTSRISFYKLLKEEFRHHLVSVFAVVLTFLAEILFFYFGVQTTLSVQGDYRDHYELLADTVFPDFNAALPSMILAVILAVEYFSYLHSQKKTDFRMSLPINRRGQYVMGILVCGIIFIIPCTFAYICEAAIGFSTGYASAVFVQNLLLKFLYTVLAYMAVWVTMTLAMIMTGNLVIAFLEFGVFSSYVPLILRWLVPTYESFFYETYASTDEVNNLWNCFSPFSLLEGINNYFYNREIESLQKFMPATLLFILLVGVIAGILYVKRPAEAAGRAMAFLKLNPIIRYAVVIPIALYFGYYLSRTTPVNSIGWLIAGTLIGVVILHGIMESIFHFDLRSMFSKKRQLGLTAVICLAFIFFFYADVTKYNEFIPEADEVESAVVIPGNGNLWFYSPSFDLENERGLSGEDVEKTIELAEYLVAERVQKEDSGNASDSMGHVSIEYKMKNGKIKARTYYVDTRQKEIRRLLDEISATEGFKEEFYELYCVESNVIELISVNRAFDSEELLLSEEEMDEFLGIYLQELTSLTFTEMEEVERIAALQVYYTQEYASSRYTSWEEYYIYRSFVKTITFLEEHDIKVGEPLDNCEMESIHFYDEYSDDGSRIESPAFSITDEAVLDEVKDEIILNDFYGNGYVSWVDGCRLAEAKIRVNGSLTSRDVMVREETVKVLEAAAE